MAIPAAAMTSTAATLHAEMAPSGLLQTFLVRQIAASMDRVDQLAAREDRDDPRRVREHVAAERGFFRALAEFRRLAKDAAIGLRAVLVPASPPKVPQGVAAASPPPIAAPVGSSALPRAGNGGPDRPGMPESVVEDILALLDAGGPKAAVPWLSSGPHDLDPRPLRDPRARRPRPKLAAR